MNDGTAGIDKSTRKRTPRWYQYRDNESGHDREREESYVRKGWGAIQLEKRGIRVRRWVRRARSWYRVGRAAG